jgi:hypothetical protein
MPLRHSHILSEGANSIYPLFVVFNDTLERIKRGLAGAELPFIIQTPDSLLEENSTDIFSPELPSA